MRKKKLIPIYILLIIVLISSVFIVSKMLSNRESPEIKFEDKNFEAGVRAFLQRPEGKIYKKEVGEIKELHLMGQKLKNINDIKWFKGLNMLSIYMNPLSDIKVLSTLHELKYLNINETFISDISPLAELTGFKELYMTDTHVVDLSPLKNLKNLQVLEVGSWEYPIHDISVLANLEELSRLELTDYGESDISAIGVLTNLKDLNIARGGITNIDDLSALKDIESLSLSYCKINSIDVLANFTYLNMVYAIERVMQQARVEAASQAVREKAIEIAKRLLKAGDSEQKVQLATDLPLETIQELAKELGM